MEWLAFYGLVLFITYGWTSSALMTRPRLAVARALPAFFTPLVWCSVCVGTWVTVALYFILASYRPPFVLTNAQLSWWQLGWAVSEAVAYYVIGLHFIQTIRPSFMSSATVQLEHTIVFGEQE